VPVSAHHDADARGNVHRAVPEGKRLLQGCQQALGHALGGRRTGGLGEQHGELVAPEATQHIVFAQALGEALGHLAQQRVSRAVAQAIVDALEAVEVQKEHSVRRVLIHERRHRDGFPHPEQKQLSIGEPGQRISIGRLHEVHFFIIVLLLVCARRPLGHT
jgi:hypothetical protein